MNKSSLLPSHFFLLITCVFCFADPDNPPSSVEEWLSSLHLVDYLDTFKFKKYDTMARVLKLWEVELISVLDISALGHRKRILASLVNRPKMDRQFPSLVSMMYSQTDSSNHKGI